MKSMLEVRFVWHLSQPPVTEGWGDGGGSPWQLPQMFEPIRAECESEPRRAGRLERVDLARRLTKLCGLSPGHWANRAQQIQARVERIAALLSHNYPWLIGEGREHTRRALSELLNEMTDAEFWEYD